MFHIRGRILAFALGVGAAAFVPGTAAAETQSFSITPCSDSVCSPLSTEFYAGGAASIKMVTTFDSSAIASHGAPSAVTVQLAAGVLANVASASNCVAGTTPQYVPGCRIGNGIGADTLKIPLNFNAYLVPATKAGDIGGVDFVSGKANTKLGHAELAVVQLTNGIVVADLNVDLSSLGLLARLLTGLTVNINAAVNGSPFTRMPSTNKPAAPSTLTVVYGTGANAKPETVIANPDVTPHAASSIPYAPELTGTAAKDSTDTGVRVTTTVTQAADGAANRSITLAIPAGAVSPNLTAALALLNSTTAVGSATAVSPLISGKLTGQVFLTGSIATPALTITFPPPIHLTLTGQVSIAGNAFSFSGLPDVPLTNLTITLYGGPQALLQTNCATPSGSLTGSFVGQNGKTASSTQTLIIRGCGAVEAASTPRLSGGSVRGLRTRHPVLRFAVTRGIGAPDVASLAVVLPRGLSFHRTTSLSGKGLSLRGGSVRALAFKGGKLMITLRKAVERLSVKLGPPLLSESKMLQRAVRHHRIGLLSLRVRVTDTERASNLLTLRLRG